MTTAAESVREALRGLDFPAEKADIAVYAEDRGAAQQLVERLRTLPAGVYPDLAAVEAAVPTDAGSAGDYVTFDPDDEDGPGAVGTGKLP